MTLEEAIEHAEKRAKKDCTECGKEHAQLAEWLRELQEYRKNNSMKPAETGK